MDYRRRPRIIIQRSWKRDGSSNYMDLKEAVANLAEKLGGSPLVIRRKLMAGSIIETPLAYFALYESSEPRELAVASAA